MGRNLQVRRGFVLDEPGQRPARLWILNCRDAVKRALPTHTNVRHGQRLCAPLIRLDRRARQTENLGWVRHRGPIR